MSRRIVIDSVSFARESRSQHGELLVADLVRVLDLLTDSAGSLRYRLDGRLSSRKRPQLLLQLDGSLSVCCQRCLEGIDYPVEVRSVLEFVNEEDLTQEEIEDDSKDFLPVESELDVVALIEDEIILNLPSAPRHDSCVLPDSGQSAGSQSPFSVLKGFLGKT